MPSRALCYFVCLFLLWIPAASRVSEGAPKLDSKTKKQVSDLATRWFKARPKTHFERWDPAVRKALLQEAKALGTIEPGSMPLYVDLLWKAVKKHGPKGKGKMDTPYGEATWIQKGRGGKKAGLILGLHGGGEGAGSEAPGAALGGARARDAAVDENLPERTVRSEFSLACIYWTVIAKSSLF